MKNLMAKVPLVGVLLVSYIILFAVIGAVRYTEYRNIKKTTEKIRALNTMSVRRQAILSDLLKSDDFLRVNELRLLYPQHTEPEPEAGQKINKEVARIAENLNQYPALIRDGKEKQLFNGIVLYEKRIQEKRNQLSQLLKAGEVSKARSLNNKEVQPAFEMLQQINWQLSDHIDQRDKADYNRLEGSILALDQHAMTTAFVIAGLLIIFGILIGITIITLIRKRNMLALSEKRYRTFLEQTNELITVFDVNGSIRFANHKFKEILGYTEEELYNFTVFDLIEEPADSLREIFLIHGKNGIIPRITKILRTKSGKEIYIKGHIVWEFDKEGHEMITGFFRDITNKRLLQTSLQESEEKFRRLFDKAPTPMYTFDPANHQFLQVNEAALLHYGYTREEFLNLTIFDIRPQDEIPRTVNSINRIINNKLDYYDFYKHLKKDGSLIDVQIFATQISLETKPVILTIVIDITERKLNENKITQTIIKTQEEERYEIGSELHDNVCQILASAKMSMGMMKSRLPEVLEPSYNQSLESITLATSEIRNLSHRLAPVFFQNTTLKESLERLLTTFNMKNNYQVSIHFDKVVKNLPLSQELQLNIYRIVQEQLRNIIKHSQAAEVKLEVLFNKNKLKILVADDGIGFDPNTKASGIGLANIKRRAEFFSGRMAVYSAPGDGCEIIITIPLHAIKN